MAIKRLRLDLAQDLKCKEGHFMFTYRVLVDILSGLLVMKTLRQLLLVLLLVPCVAMAAESMNSIVAVVGDEVITELDIQQEKEYLEQQGINVDNFQAFDNLVKRNLQVNKARLYNFDIDVEQRISEVRYDIENTLGQEFTNDEEFVEFLTINYNKNYDQLRLELEEEMLMQLLFQTEVLPRIKITDDEIEEFLKSETEAGVEQRYHLEHLSFDKKDDSITDAEIEKFASSLQPFLKNQPWQTDAQKHSTDKIEIIMNDLGVRNLEQLPDVFVAAARNLTVGGISDVIKINNGYHLLKLISSQGGELRSSINRFHVSHIFLTPQDKELSKKLVKSIKDGEIDFADAVKKYSTDESSVEKKGSLGWFLLEDLPEYLSNVVFPMQEGDISDTVESPYGLHILKLEKKETSDLDIASMRRKAIVVLRERNAIDERDTWVEELRNSTHILILDPSYL